MRHKKIQKVSYILLFLSIAQLQAAHAPEKKEGEKKDELMTYDASSNLITDENLSQYTIGIDAVLEDLEKQGQQYTFGALEFSNNYLTMEGATKLLKWLVENASSKPFGEVKRCDLSFNRIYASDNEEVDQPFEESLREVLMLKKIVVNLAGNPIGNSRWLCSFTIDWRDSLSQKDVNLDEEMKYLEIFLTKSPQK